MPVLCTGHCNLALLADRHVDWLGTGEKLLRICTQNEFALLGGQEAQLPQSGRMVRRLEYMSDEQHKKDMQ